MKLLVLILGFLLLANCTTIPVPHYKIVDAYGLDCTRDLQAYFGQEIDIRALELTHPHKDVAHIVQHIIDYRNLRRLHSKEVVDALFSDMHNFPESGNFLELRAMIQDRGFRFRYGPVCMGER